jgi:hypothetical protein
VQELNTLDQAPAQAGCVLRLFWMLVGNAIVYGSLTYVALNKLAFPGVLDVVVWLTVVLTILARRLDITRWQGTTATGEPATLEHWRRHAAIVVLAAAVGSVMAHMIGR